MKKSRNLSPAQLRARAVQTAGCCDGYVGMATFGSQMSLDANAALRKFMLDNESMETAELQNTEYRICDLYSSWHELYVHTALEYSSASEYKRSEYRCILYCGIHGDGMGDGVGAWRVAVARAWALR